MYKVVKVEELANASQYKWFGTFANPCYGFDVACDVTEVVRVGKQNGTHFFANMLYLVTKGLSSVPAMRMRQVEGEIRLYDVINPTFTVMTDNGQFENAGFPMVEDYHGFYEACLAELDRVKRQTVINEKYNDSSDYDDYYITCIPWMSYASMTHPLPSNNPESSSVPRVCWDKYRNENGRYVLNLNITVSHCFVDGRRLTDTFEAIKYNFTHAAELLK